MIQLNRQQREAAGFLHGVASVVAVPGSGKTITMTHRIANLIRNGIAPETILGLTFTRNAAQTMRNRLLPLLGKEAKKVTLSTIHSFCHNLLRNEGRSYEILHGAEQVRVIKKILQKSKISVPVGQVLQEIGLAKNNLISCSDYSRYVFRRQDNESDLPGVFCLRGRET